MPKISVTPVKKVDISICLADLPEIGQVAVLMALIDEITESYVPPNEFWDACALNRHHDWIDIQVPIDSDQAGEFVQKISQAYDMVASRD